MTPWVLRLIFANIAMFILASLSPALNEQLMLVPALAFLRPWTLVTYMFLHGGFGHIFFNMLALFFFGPRLEAELGSKNFLLLYFISGIMGGLLSFFFTPYTAIIGASGAVYGVMFGFARYWPRELLYIWGVFPVQARWLVVGMTVLSLFGGFGNSSDGVAHFAHLGGFVGGFLFLTIVDRKVKTSIPDMIPVSAEPTAKEIERWMTIRRENLHEVNREELDRILLKMQTNGAASLTSQERSFLDRFSLQ